jgi:hypothetical protein
MEMSMQTERDSIRTFIRKDLRWQTDFMAKHPTLPRQLAIYVETGCDLNCLFCGNKPPSFSEKPIDALEKCEKMLAENRELKFTDISIAANEALSFPNIGDLIAMCRKYGFSKVEIITSGVRLFDVAFAKALVSAGATSFCIPLYAPTPEVHDAVTRSRGSFQKAVTGIKNVLGMPGSKVHIHTLALNRNIDVIDELAAFTQSNFGIPLLVFPVRLKKHLPSPDAAREIVPSLAKIKDRVRHSFLIGFPCCISSYKTQGKSKSAPSVPNSLIYYILGQKYVHHDFCRPCVKRKDCVGVISGYSALHGMEGLEPFANSI